MKKLYNRKGKVHPTPPVVADHLLSFLPAAILTLTVALSPEDKEVLAYLKSCSSSANFSKKSSGADHPQCFNCNCFGCYIRYWVKWDSSVNRHLIHEILDAFEDSCLLKESKKVKSKRERRKGKSVKEDKILELDESKNFGVSLTNEDLSFSVEEENIVDEDEREKGSVSSFVSFLGERIWSVWGSS
ncbi:hypothetical protein ACJIZ3_012798 [Penstemon smallii]|uniref:Uncharacterized protein n=1 Tax=Penstemon smallii TaxID=265156 RepID=A0ABD3UPM8_9LAMI